MSTPQVELVGSAREAAVELQSELIRIRSTFRKNARDGIEPSAAQALVLLALTPRQSVTQLSARLSLSHAAMSYAMGSLEEAELVKSAKSNEDARRTEYVMTELGLARAERFVAAAAEHRHR